MKMLPLVTLEFGMFHLHISFMTFHKKLALIVILNFQSTLSVGLLLGLSQGMGVLDK